MAPDAVLDRLITRFGLLDPSEEKPSDVTLELVQSMSELAGVVRETRREVAVDRSDDVSEYQLAMWTLGQVGVPWAIDGRMLTMVERIQWLAHRAKPGLPELFKAQTELVAQLTATIDRAVRTLSLATGDDSRSQSLDRIVGIAAERLQRKDG